MQEFEQGGLTAQKAADQANKQRNEAVKMGRERGTKLGKAIAEAMKSADDLPELPFFEEKNAKNMFGKKFADLSTADKIEVWREIIESSGRDRATVSEFARNLSPAGRAIFLLSAAVAMYEVLTADNKGEASLREGSIMGGGVIGGALGGAAAGGPSLGPFGIAIGVLAGGIAGALGEEFTIENFNEIFKAPADDVNPDFFTGS